MHFSSHERGTEPPTTDIYYTFPRVWGRVKGMHKKVSLSGEVARELEGWARRIEGILGTKVGINRVVRLLVEQAREKVLAMTPEELIESMAGTSGPGRPRKSDLHFGGHRFGGRSVGGYIICNDCGLKWMRSVSSLLMPECSPNITDEARNLVVKLVNGSNHP